MSSASEGPARRAVSGGEGMEITNTELETASPAPQPSSVERGPQPGPQIARIFAARQGDHVENTQHNQSFHDGRRVDQTQNILQQVDQRQVHVHTDHNAVLEAAAAVTVANDRVAAVENQALQAVLEARGQAEQTVAQVQAQAEVLSVRFAAELQLSHQRENVLREQLEGTRQQLARVQEQLDEEKMRRLPIKTKIRQNTETGQNKILTCCMDPKMAREILKIIPCCVGWKWLSVNKIRCMTCCRSCGARSFSGEVGHRRSKYRRNKDQQQSPKPQLHN